MRSKLRLRGRLELVGARVHVSRHTIVGNRDSHRVDLVVNDHGASQVEVLVALDDLDDVERVLTELADARNWLRANLRRS
jgi:hypothetical protein